jgi:RNA polymerase sigma-70 factor (ECF subfamily)
VQQQDERAVQRATIADLLPELRAAARLLTRSRAEADDLVQDAVLRMLRGLGGFVPPPAEEADLRTAMRAWGLAILRNAFRADWRRRRREHVHAASQPREEEARNGGQDAAAQMHDLVRALAALPPALREALVLVGAQGLSHEQAAAICRVPVGTMKARVSRARDALAKALGPVMR